MAVATTTAAVAKAKAARVSLVLKPSNGGPFADFILGDDLHIGILDHTHALVTSFYPCGIRSEPQPLSWTSGIELCSCGTHIDSSFIASFLRGATHRYNAQTYHASTFNCFDFVLDFVDFRGSKQDFVDSYVKVPLLRAVCPSMLVNRDVKYF
uniref:PPPDE domain-containing protein n=1 Tax=Panagrellus redivivus TaxID=6233 RepID=A0A7E4V5U1_PANRE